MPPGYINWLDEGHRLRRVYLAVGKEGHGLLAAILIVEPGFYFERAADLEMDPDWRNGGFGVDKLVPGSSSNGSNLVASRKVHFCVLLNLISVQNTCSMTQQRFRPHLLLLLPVLLLSVLPLNAPSILLFQEQETPKRQCTPQRSFVCKFQLDLLKHRCQL